MWNLLHKGEALTILNKFSEDRFDLTITSPPYNKQEKNKGGLVDSVVYDKYKDALPEDEYQQNQIEVMNEVYRVTKPGGSFFYNHKIRWDRGEMYHPLDWVRKTDWTVKQEIVWDRVIAANIRGWRFWQVEERIYWLYKPIDDNLIGKELESKDAKLTSIWRGLPESGKKNSHPAPFPLWIPARIIISILDDEGLVLDPYIGSGTTAIASHLLGHNSVGIDVSYDYLDSTSKRLNKAEGERQEIDKEIALHRVKNKAHRSLLGNHTTI